MNKLAVLVSLSLVLGAGYVCNDVFASVNAFSQPQTRVIASAPVLKTITIAHRKVIVKKECEEVNECEYYGVDLNADCQMITICDGEET